MGLSNTQKGILFALAGYNFFTLSDTSVKLLGDSYSAIDILFWSYFFSLFLCIALAFPKGLKKSFASKKLTVHLLRSVCMLLVAFSAACALTSGLALPTFYTIVFLSPALTAVMALILYKEKISRLGWGVIILGFTGIVIAFTKDASFSSPAIIYCFGVLFFGAAVNLTARPIGKNESMLTFPFYPALVITILLVAYFLLYEKNGLPVLNMTDIPIFTMNAFFVLMGQMLVMQGFRIAPYAYVSPMQYTQMLSGIAAGYYIFADIPGPWMLVGASIIIISGILLITQKK